jgi:hypothetical protein
MYSDGVDRLQHLSLFSPFRNTIKLRLERDMKGIHEIWRKRSKNISDEKLGLQCRLSSNHKARGSVGPDAEILEAARAFWIEEEHRSRGVNKRQRSDAGGPATDIHHCSMLDRASQPVGLAVVMAASK